ncbi:MAG: C45 family autoproteolytic acyltransferase/hydrolase [Spirochaetia bacterium]|jgi:hypothetical protein
MSFPEPLTERQARVAAAFDLDGFAVTGTAEKGGFLGVVAEHRSARIGASTRPKRAFYLEGDNYQMGFLLGLLARNDVIRMTHEFLQNVVFSFFDSKAAGARGVSTDLRRLIVRVALSVSRDVLPDIPKEYLEEIQGIVDGCDAGGRGSDVTRDALITLNFGIDAVLAHVYSGSLFARKGFRPEMLRTPIGCNAFFIGGEAAGGKCFLGRDFMFPTANVYQDTACLIVYRPSPRGGKVRHPFVSQTAPGIVGSMTGMNAAGVAMGVNMLPSRFCSPKRPGFNSLPLVRDCVQYCGTTPEAVERIAEAQRGVSWLYPVADAQGRACVVEAGRKLGPREPFPYFTWVPWHYRRRLPSLGFIRRLRRRHGTPSPHGGVMARGNEYRLPAELVGWNERLWGAFDRDWFVKIIDFAADLVGMVVDLFKGGPGFLWKAARKDVEALHEGADFSKVDFSERGFINSTWTEKNCPGPFYFAPQRADRADVLVATNHALSPEIRLTSMNEWIALLAGGNLNEIQWRYDELNREILDAIAAAPAGITEETAWGLINFLRPDGRFPEFYDGAREEGRIQVHGSVSLCELTSRWIKSLYGYYGDEPIILHLEHFLK